MDKEFFVWDEVTEGIAISGIDSNDEIKYKGKRKRVKAADSNSTGTNRHLVLEFKETLSFFEQSKFRLHYRRQVSKNSANDVVLLQDIKDIVLYLLNTAITIELVEFLHLAIVDRFLRALILYFQDYIVTWKELGERRAATAKRAPNPLAGGARLDRSNEMTALRCCLAREYADILTACQREARRYHHVGAGKIQFVQSKGAKDLRIFEGTMQIAHRIVWIALGRKHKKLIELELDRLFRTEAFNSAKRRFERSGEAKELLVPVDEQWILYGPKLPQRQKILRNSPMPWELLNTDCDHRFLSLGLTSEKSQDPRVVYLENAILANEAELAALDIKVGILGMPRADFDLLLIPVAGDDDQQQTTVQKDDDDQSIAQNEGADDYETLLPASGTDLELSKPFSSKRTRAYICNEKLRAESRKKWVLREKKRAIAKNTDDSQSMPATLSRNDA
ncbi:hypothetical protein TKK_0006027 [Trichogramma kaykai]|uniref:Uncharacterized protein n=1 Tax=Trichogramma kaykai TaxID=54128 RepID=A0ABD2XF15_9HYME